MTKDYREILSGTVEEVKDAVDDLDDPDFEKLLKLEREGKDRKTVKEYFKGLMEDSDETVEESEEDHENDSEGEDEELDSEDVEVTGGSSASLVESIEKSLGSLSTASVLGLGLVVGLVVGAGAAQMFGTSSYPASSSEVKSDMQELLSGPNRTVNVGPAMRQHGMYYFNVSSTRLTANGTRTRYRQFYVTSDGELLFPKLSVPLLGLRTPVNLQNALAQRRNATR